jgi:hypothetical protein
VGGVEGSRLSTPDDDFGHIWKSIRQVMSFSKRQEQEAFPSPRL